MGDAHAFAHLAERCAGRTGDPTAIFTALRETAEELVDGRAACLRYLAQTRELIPVGAASEGVLSRPGPLVVDEWPALASALAERQAAEAPDPPENVRLRTPLAVPIAAARQPLGVLLAEPNGGRPLDDRRVDLLRSVGSIGGVLVEAALAHERTERLSELKGQFIALAAHEVRAPFAVMHGVITTLANRPDLPHDQVHSLQQALVEQSERTTRLIDQLLDLSRLDASRIPIERTRFEARRRVQNLVEMVAGDRAGDVEIEVPEDLEVEADLTAFDRIVSNLVVNALRHGRAPVTVAARQRDTHFRLTVEDRGSGVDAAFVPRLFDRFARGGKADDGKGSGLGLSIAQSYAQAHGGELVYSHADPHGARFELVLPRGNGPAQSAAADRSVSSTSPA